MDQQNDGWEWGGDGWHVSIIKIMADGQKVVRSVILMRQWESHVSRVPCAKFPQELVGISHKKFEKSHKYLWDFFVGKNLSTGNPAKSIARF